MMFTSDNFAIYHQIKTSIGFQYKRKLNSKSLIQLSKILPFKLIRTHKFAYQSNLFSECFYLSLNAVNYQLNQVIFKREKDE